MLRPDALEAMMHLGFTALEGNIYAFLLGESPATGYRIAQAIGKPAANTYKALQTLEQKGAILIEEGDSRLCTPVPLDELMARLSSEFAARRAVAEKALKKYKGAVDDERIYPLRSASQVEAKAIGLIESAQTVILATIVSIGVPQVLASLVEKATSGVDVAIAGSIGGVIDGVEIYPWAGDGCPQLQIAVDESSFLTARYQSDGSFEQGYWSGSRSLAELTHQGIAARICLLGLSTRVDEGAGPKRLARAVNAERKVGHIREISPSE